MGMRGALAIPLTLLFAAAVPGQPPAGEEREAPSYTITEDEVIFATDENKGITFMEFVKLAQQVTGRTFMPPEGVGPSPAAPTGIQPGAAGAGPRIAILGRMRVRKENFFSFFQTVLRIKDYAVVRRGQDDTEIYEIISLASPKRQEVKNAVRFVPVEELSNFAQDEGTVILTTVRLKYTNPQQASNTLRPLFTDPQGFAQLQAVGDSQALALVGFAPWVWTIYRMIQLVDVPEEIDQPVVRIVRLQHASADELEPILSDLITARGGVIQAARRPQTGQQRPQGQEIEPKVLPEPRTNALILTASRSDMPLIENLVVMLDTPMEDVEGDFHVIQLTNVLARDVQRVLGDFLTRTQQAEQQARQGQGRARTVREIRPVVVADDKSNSLLVTAAKTRYAEILKIVERIDVRRPQVLIEAALVEVDVNSTFDIGAELGLVDVAAQGNKFTRPFGFTNFGLSQFQDTDNNGLPDTRLPNFDNPPRGLLGGIISGGDFSIPVLLNLNKTDALANVLSIPSVLVNDNEEATVESTREVATQTSNQGTATTSTGFSGYQPAGISLKISPSISESNYLKLHIDLEVSRFLGSASNPALPPDKITRKITTQVTMPSGHTLVLGGVLQDDSSNSNTGVPILKDIPVLGWLFGSHSKSAEKLNLYFFVTPFILDETDFSDLKDISYHTKLEAQQFIGKERIQLVDRKWSGGKAPRIEDSQVSAEDLEHLGGFELPSYTPPRSGERPAAEGAQAPAAPSGSPEKQP